MSSNLLNPSFYKRTAKEVARSLIGTILVSRIAGLRVSGMVVETEAYLATRDAASHGTQGPNRKNRSMFGPAGRAYVYPIHARYCFNAVTGIEGIASAVLIRAVEPIDGIKVMQQRRQRESLKLLTSGPARLCEAFALNRQQDGISLTTRRTTWLEQNPAFTADPKSLRATRRIGVTSAKNLKLRFVLRGNLFVSGPRYLG
ncbi:MAG: DNA-3-methyladenine glycosylase [Mariniblastus sp.]|nr:DNA-3-methyladenine glycosylase [Mariniblastus sp.]